MLIPEMEPVPEQWKLVLDNWITKGHRSFLKYQRAGMLHPRFDGRTWSSLTTEERRPFEED